MSQDTVALILVVLTLTPFAATLLAWVTDVLARRHETIARRLDREHAERHAAYARRRT